MRSLDTVRCTVRAHDAVEDAVGHEKVCCLGLFVNYLSLFILNWFLSFSFSDVGNICCARTICHAYVRVHLYECVCTPWALARVLGTPSFCCCSAHRALLCAAPLLCFLFSGENRHSRGLRASRVGVNDVCLVIQFLFCCTSPPCRRVCLCKFVHT